MNDPSQGLQKTALHDWHREHGGRMVDFAGWSLPVFYEAGALEEHHVTRRSIGLFDIDHMGQIIVEGDDAVGAVNRLVSSSIGDLAVGRARYGLLCNERGGVVDDVIVYRLADDRVLVVVNAANRATDLAWIEQHIGSECQIEDRSGALEMIAVQGPNAVPLIDSLATVSSFDGTPLESVSGLSRFAAARVEVCGVRGIVARTGYTGEDGVEFYVEDGGGVELWTGLLAAASSASIEALPVGLGARDSLRFEPGYPLYGHELADDITPFESRLGWAVDLEGGDFLGRDGLVASKASGLVRRLETIAMVDRGVPREGSVVLDSDGDPVGQVVSGMFAPTADVFAANVFLPREVGALGSELQVDLRGKSKSCTVVQRPLYRRDD